MNVLGYSAFACYLPTVPTRVYLILPSCIRIRPERNYLFSKLWVSHATIPGGVRSFEAK